MTMRTRLATILVVAAWIGWPPFGRADEFDRLSGDVLARLVAEPGAKARPSLGFRDLEALPVLLRDHPSALVLVKTDQGNLARLLAAPAFRKRPNGDGPLIPVLSIDRFEVFDGGSPRTRLARGKDLLLFDGFRLDLDTGQIVPDELGGDLLFEAREMDGAVRPLGSAQLFTLDALPNLPAPPPGQPSDGRVARPGDFNGRFRVVANGQWTGAMEITVNPDGKLAGTYQSDASGSSFAVTGEVDPEHHQKVRFTIQFPRTKQDYQGVLWTEGKQVMTGTMTMTGQEFGFLALRDGARLALTDDDAPASLTASAPDHAILAIQIGDQADVVAIGEKTVTTAELTEVLAKTVKNDPGLNVKILAAEDVPYHRVRQVINAAHRAGIRSILLNATSEAP